MDTLTVKMKKDNARKLAVGDTIGTTTSSFDYDSYDCRFDDNVDMMVTVKAHHVYKDYSEYNPDKGSTGGAYGYDKWMVRKILNLERI